MDVAQANAVNAWILQQITQVTDTDSHMWQVLTRVARQSVKNLCSSDVDVYEADLAGHGDRERSEYVEAVGGSVARVLGEWIDENIDWPELRTMVADVFDLGDSAFQRLLGEHYLPEAGDLA